MFKKTYECIFCGTVVLTAPGDDEKLAAEAHIKCCPQHPYREQAKKVLDLEEALQRANLRLQDDALSQTFRARYEVLFDQYARLYSELMGSMPEQRVTFADQVDRAAEHLERIREQLRLHTEELQVRKDQITNLRSDLNVERAAANTLKASFREIYETAVGYPFDPSEPWTYGTMAVISKIKGMQKKDNIIWDLEKEIGRLKLQESQLLQQLQEAKDSLLDRSAFSTGPEVAAYKAILREILSSDPDRPTQGMTYAGAVPVFIKRYKELREFAAWAKKMFLKAQVEGTADINYGLRKLEGFNFDKG